MQLEKEKKEKKREKKRVREKKKEKYFKIFWNDCLKIKSVQDIWIHPLLYHFKIITLTPILDRPRPSFKPCH